MKRNIRAIRIILLLTVCLVIILPLAVFTQRQPQLDITELQAVFKRLHLLAEKRHIASDQEVKEIEEADSKLYAPVSGTTIFLEAVSATKDSDGFKPRYWLRVEDYSMGDAAAKRAAEYRTVETYDRIAQVMPKVSAFMVSKSSVRLWAVARGKRVYALTTNVSLFTFIDLQKKIKTSIEELPETS